MNLSFSSLRVDAARLRATFLALLRHNSPPGQEREVSRLCAEYLQDAGFVCQHDRAGNLIAQKAGNRPGSQRLFFSAHTDTVLPTDGLIVREEDGWFLTSGTTILGADDKAGLAEIIEAVTVLAERDLPHPDLQVIFSSGEEVGLLGAYALAPEVLAGSIGFVFDAGGRTGSIITSSPTHRNLTARFRGRAAHAGFAPEQGISALMMAARAVTAMRLGRIDPETTANVGVLQGGSANNVVAEDAFLTLEARSRNPETLEALVRHLRDCVLQSAADLGGEVEIDETLEYRGYAWDVDDPMVQLAARAWRALEDPEHPEPELRPTGGGSDGNVFNARGIPALAVSCGYVDAHSSRERISLRDLVRGAEWAVEIARQAATRPVQGGD